MAIDPEQLSKRFSCNVESICIGNGVPWVVRRLLYKYSNEIDGTKIIVVDISSWFFNSNYCWIPLEANAPRGLRMRYYYYRRYSDWQVISGQQKPLLKDMLLPVRWSLKDINRSQFKGGTPFTEIRKNYRLMKSPPSSPNCRLLYNNVVADMEKDKVIFNHYMAYETVQLAKDCAKKGIHVVFNIPPCPDNGQKFGDIDFQNNYNNLLNSLTKLQNVTIISEIQNRHDWINGNISDQYLFRDHGHMFPAGSKFYT
jgi:hypothetical protein